MRELALHLLDLAQNALAAGATRIRFEVRLSVPEDSLILAVADNGKGIPAEILDKVDDPFHTSRLTRRVGLGLPLLKAAAERCGGGMTIESTVGTGTTVRAKFRLSSVDRAPLGDLAGTIVGLVACNPHLDLELAASWNGIEYEFTTAACREILGPDVSLADPAVLDYIRCHLAAGLADLKRLDEI